MKSDKRPVFFEMHSAYSWLITKFRTLLTSGLLIFSAPFLITSAYSLPTVEGFNPKEIGMVRSCQGGAYKPRSYEWNGLPYVAWYYPLYEKNRTVVMKLDGRLRKLKYSNYVSGSEGESNGIYGLIYGEYNIDILWEDTVISKNISGGKGSIKFTLEKTEQSFGIPIFVLQGC
ncbi:hypothetical protein [Prochlorococcus sp. MIT 1300]|uniref:hypothetical protein n=1 Tax=Prochlorococcus sp. MIT 1300 TaxID=3096218 RepID=UPI002A748626|nr:hypothetical protein [Prochlorococcus sp. MIT 1300]